MPMQEIEGNPTCEKCGHEAAYNWIDVLKRLNMGELRRNPDHKCISMGQMNGNLTTSKASEVGCYHCGAQVKLNDQTQLPVSCPACSMDLHVTRLEAFSDMFFYREIRNKAGKKNEGESMIAIRCSACGAPLKVDPSKQHYSCEFCNVDNVLPPVKQTRLVLNNLYAAVKYEIFPKQLAFETHDPEIVKRVLRNVDKSKFTTEEIDKLVTKFPQDAGIINIILTEYKSVPSHTSLEQLWNETRNQQTLILVGPKLGKSQAEIDSRIREFNPQHKKPANVIQKKDTKSNKGVVIMIIVVVLVVATVLCLKYLT